MRAAELLAVAVLVAVAAQGCHAACSATPEVLSVGKHSMRMDSLSWSIWAYPSNGAPYLAGSAAITANAAAARLTWSPTAPLPVAGTIVIGAWQYDKDPSFITAYCANPVGKFSGTVPQGSQIFAVDLPYSGVFPELAEDGALASYRLVIYVSAGDTTYYLQSETSSCPGASKTFSYGALALRCPTSTLPSADSPSTTPAPTPAPTGRGGRHGGRRAPKRGNRVPAAEPEPSDSPSRPARGGKHSRKPKAGKALSSPAGKRNGRGARGMLEVVVQALEGRRQ